MRFAYKAERRGFTLRLIPSIESRRAGEQGLEKVAEIVIVHAAQIEFVARRTLGLG